MAFIGRRQPVATQERPKARPTPTSRGGDGASGGGSGSGSGAARAGSTGRFGRLRRNILDIRAELAKVTWPTREETRNLTIVVIGITAVLGGILGTLDALLSYLYTTVSAAIK